MKRGLRYPEVDLKQGLRPGTEVGADRSAGQLDGYHSAQFLDSVQQKVALLYHRLGRGEFLSNDRIYSISGFVRQVTGTCFSRAAINCR